MQNPLEDIQRRIKGRNKTELARRAGVASSKIFQIANDPSRDILVSTLMKLDAALTEMEEESRAE